MALIHGNEYMLSCNSIVNITNLFSLKTDLKLFNELLSFFLKDECQLFMYVSINCIYS